MLSKVSEKFAVGSIMVGFRDKAVIPVNSIAGYNHIFLAHSLCVLFLSLFVQHTTYIFYSCEQCFSNSYLMCSWMITQRSYRLGKDH